MTIYLKDDFWRSGDSTIHSSTSTVGLSLDVCIKYLKAT